MQRSDTGSGKVWRGRASRATVAAILLASGALAGLPPAYAISPPTIDPGAVPPDAPPGIKCRNLGCAETPVSITATFTPAPRPNCHAPAMSSISMYFGGNRKSVPGMTPTSVQYEFCFIGATGPGGLSGGTAPGSIVGGEIA